jgi:hypothetical protein
MNHLVVLLITNMPKGQQFELKNLYTVIYNTFPAECQKLGFTNSYPVEPKWKNQIRYGLWASRKMGLIKHVGTSKSGEWVKL